MKRKTEHVKMATEVWDIVVSDRLVPPQSWQEVSVSQSKVKGNKSNSHNKKVCWVMGDYRNTWGKESRCYSYFAKTAATLSDKTKCFLSLSLIKFNLKHETFMSERNRCATGWTSKRLMMSEQEVAATLKTHHEIQPQHLFLVHILSV